MKTTLATTYSLLLVLFILYMLVQYVFRWQNLPNLIPLSN
ncbi:MAG: hypothetical protein QOH93_2212 [Chloroflexia bacterium]|jgi:hypothetical protein|nr:hypothetical protein [Chloroflexia bacterium]